MKASNMQEDSTINLVDLSRDRRGVARFIDYDREIPKGMTWDLREYLPESKKRKCSDKFFNPKKDMIMFLDNRDELVDKDELIGTLQQKYWLGLDAFYNLMSGFGFEYSREYYLGLTSKFRSEKRNVDVKTKHHKKDSYIKKVDKMFIKVNDPKTIKVISELYDKVSERWK